MTSNRIRTSFKVKYVKDLEKRLEDAGITVVKDEIGNIYLEKMKLGSIGKTILQKWYYDSFGEMPDIL